MTRNNHTLVKIIMKSRIDESGMRRAFLEALEQRIATNPSGKISLPTGVADAGEISKVLRAIERLRQTSGGE